MPGPTNDPPGGGAPQHGDAVLEKTRQETKEPSLYKVILLNDDYTTMEFVVLILEQVFLKSPAEAFRVMMHVHTQGKGLCGLYPFDIAETKIATVHEMAKEHGFPLRADMEPE
jgi:ATP-dependent Clp protease adaptor protein ClpS